MFIKVIAFIIMIIVGMIFISIIGGFLVGVIDIIFNKMKRNKDGIK